ncbi:hypothetical protein X777_12970 [Ooceraea biroi]|uniref:THAP-type domain-containing protein n=1 Tax=Ooceraea biroi TaxID=2015173 RepID=A0A026W1I4_OOCBI|nr:hypothetical protein X777_12970 [Ooceraea biroi]
MVKVCCAKNCRNFWIPNTNLTFHTFPWSNKQRLEEWMNVVPSKSRIGKYSFICSAHFND